MSIYTWVSSSWLVVVIAMMTSSNVVESFGVTVRRQNLGRASWTKQPASSSTQVFISKRVADMIDQEFYREQHRKEFEQEWMNQNKKILTYHVVQEDEVEVVMHSKFNDFDDEENFRSRAKDRILAQQNPQGYCADRCLSTGNCDIFEEMFQFSPHEVMDFCRDCVLAQEDEPCDVPDAFYQNSKLRP